MYRDIIDIFKYLGFSGEVKFMGFRTLEISCAADIHIKEGQLKITTDGRRRLMGRKSNYENGMYR